MNYAFQELDCEIQGAQKSMIIEYKYVRGHSRIYGNEQADRLAKIGARK